jgi:hypothetical protein
MPKVLSSMTFALAFCWAFAVTLAFGGIVYIIYAVLSWKVKKKNKTARSKNLKTAK